MDPLLTGEQAVLGAVLLDPRQLGGLDWLEPRDFYRPGHQALFAALRKLRTEDHPALSTQGAVPVAWLTDTLAEAGQQVRGLTASYLHTLVAACPRPAHAPLYGRMVLEGSIHRTVAEHADRLLAVAREDAGQHEVHGTAAQADVLAGVLDDLATRWGTRPRAAAPRTPPLPAAGEPPAAAQTEDEQFLLSLLVHQNGAIGEVFDWLRPQDFAVPGHGQLYRCLGALHHRGEPIDPVTTLWEVQRRGLLAEGVLTEQQLGPVLRDGAAGSAEWLGEQLLRSSLTRAAAGAAQQIAAHADDRRLAPGQLISHALHALGPLEEVRARWRTATSPPAAQPRFAPDQESRVKAARARSPTQPSPRPGPEPSPSAPPLPGGVRLPAIRHHLRSSS
ncbi:DnaB-like helicase N-terminal domain-containing protein [Streptomyces sp. CBMA123]|uniref:DnaB-like helicase N-terminal domain-containing protein n=1 Tax=Streptomyces sp. CBMA123 TaxID=1896313 RepID=UPI001661CFDB|nr:DnaB-like helicase N-terminal domain-containing protein [Streptomyces sp. CBMA123]MBD0692432.1 helicase DnaB [Streptomyces sp. CBMA123]